MGGRTPATAFFFLSAEALAKEEKTGAPFRKTAKEPRRSRFATLRGKPDKNTCPVVKRSFYYRGRLKLYFTCPPKPWRRRKKQARLPRTRSSAGAFQKNCQRTGKNTDENFIIKRAREIKNSFFISERV